MLASAFSTPCSSASTSGQSVSLPKGTLIKQLLKQEAQSPALARKHLQQLQEQTLIRQKSSSTTTHPFDERLASVSAFPTSGAVAARASTPSENPTLTPASLRDGGHSDSTSNTRNEGAFRGDAFPSSDRPNTSPTASHSSTEESFIGGPPTSGKEKFQCPHCSEIVTGRKNLQDHLAKVHAQDLYGFQISPTVDNRAALISYIDQNSILSRWNWTNPNLAVREGDMIVSVNGVSDDLGAMRSQMQCPSIVMRVQRR